MNRRTLLARGAALGVGAATGSLLAPRQAAAKAWVLGVSYQALQFEYVDALQVACQTRAKKLGVKLLEKDAAGDASKELANVEALINQGINALVFEPLDLTASIPAVKAAKKAGLPVVEFNSFTNDDADVDAFVISEHRQSGVLIAQYLVKLVNQSTKPKVDVLYLRGQQGNITELVRNGGFQDTIKPILGRLTMTTKVANFSRTDAQRITEDVLTRDRNVDIIVALSDSMLLGALQVVNSTGLGGKIKMVGMDGLPETLAAIPKGLITATCFQNPQAQGEGGVQTAVDILNGHPPAVKRKIIPFVMTDKSNLDQVLPISKAVYHK